MNVLKRIDNSVIVISLLTLFTFFILFISRMLDDNRLTSWQWVFAGVDAVYVFFILILGIAVAGIISRIAFLERYPAVFLFLFSFSISALFWRAPEVIVDASRYFTQAKHIEVYGLGYFFREWGRDIIVWTDMPLVPLLYGLIFKLFGESRLYIHIFTTSIFSMTVVLTYQTGKTLWGKETGFSGGLLLLGIPYLLTQTPLMLVDVPAMFFLALAIYSFIKALKRGGSWIPLASFAIFLAFFSKYSAWLMLSVLIVIFVVYLKIDFSPSPLPPPIKGGGTGEETPLIKGGITLVPLPLREGLGEGARTILFRGALIVSVAALLIGIVFWYKFDVFSEQIRLLIFYQKPGLRRWEESFISTFFFQIHPFITASAIYSAYVAVKKRDIKYVIISWLIMLILLLQIKRIRYIIMIFPLLTLMASYGLQQIGNKEVKKFIVSCIAASSIIIAVFAYLPFVQKISTINLQKAGEFLDSINEPYVEVFTISPQKPVANIAVSVSMLDLFTKKKIYYNYSFSIRDAGLTVKEIKESSMRFTWEYRNPKYYIDGHMLHDNTKDNENKRHPENTAYIVISESADSILPDDIRKKMKGYLLTKVFDAYEDIFSFRTSVRVYQKTDITVE